jgi:hypothetical protein
MLVGMSVYFFLLNYHRDITLAAPAKFSKKKERERRQRKVSSE